MMHYDKIKPLVESLGIAWEEGEPLNLSKSALLKVSELIVRECAEVAEDYVDAENNKLVETVHISSWRLQDAIKEHFGVE